LGPVETIEPFFQDVLYSTAGVGNRIEIWISFLTVLKAILEMPGVATSQENC
jgi:hypothetical protein